MATMIKIRTALFDNSYFRILATPDCKFDPLATDHILMQPQALSKRELGAALKCDQLPVV